MKKILLLLLLSYYSNLIAQEISLNTVFNYTKFDKEESTNNNIVNLNIIDNKKLSEYLDLDYYITIFKIRNKNIKNKNLYINYNEEHIAIKSMLARLHSKNYNHSIYFGIIPFNGGKFSEIKNYYKKSNGNGLEILSDITLEGVFYNYSYSNNFSFNIGYAKYDTWYNSNSINPKNEDSDGIFNIVSYKKDNHYFEFNNFFINENLKEKHYGKLILLGLGYIYNDELNSGLIFSLELGASRSKENIESILNLDSMTSSYLESQGYIVKDTDLTGYAFKTSITYKYDYFLEQSTTLEYFKTYKNWASLNSGNMFQSNYDFWQNKVSNQIGIIHNTRINEKINVSVSLYRTLNKEFPNYFSNASSTTENKENAFSNTTKVYIGISYEFKGL